LLIPGFIVVALYLSPCPQWLAFVVVACLLLLATAVEAARLSSPSFNVKVTRALGPIMRQRESTRVSGNTWYLLGAAAVLRSFPLDIAAVSIIYLSWVDPFASLIGMLWGKYTYQFKNKKTLAGTLAGVVMGAFVTFLFYGFIAHTRVANGMASSVFWSPVKMSVASSHRHIAQVAAHLEKLIPGLSSNPIVQFILNLILAEGTIGLSSVTVSMYTLATCGGILASLAELAQLNGVDDNLIIPLITASALQLTQTLVQRIAIPA
jgi:dolichol kinase